jgi:transcriptional regulator with XRE-family HTH domain
MAKAQSGVSERIRLSMDLSGLTQSELAKKLGISQAAVSGWLRGSKTPTSDNVEALAGVLNSSPQWLLYGEGPGPTPDLAAARDAYRNLITWEFRHAPPDGGRDYGNANVWAFDPTIWVMVRDVIQNCRDAMAAGAASVDVVFKIIRLRGRHLEDFKKAIAWDSLLPHLKASAEIDQRLGRRIKHTLAKLEEEKELILLVVEDRGTIGLIGEEDGEGNFAALVRNNLDSNKQSQTAGGAFGLGKAVLWRMSAFSLVLFSSNLSKPSGDGRQLRRVMGRCDLPWHECDDGTVETVPFAGPGWFGRENGERTVSVWDNAALVNDLYMGRGEDVGTSVAIIGFHDPSNDEDLSPADMAKKIKEAVADCFWPDLTMGRLRVRVDIYEGPIRKSSSEVAAEEFRQEFVDLLTKWKNDEETVDALKKPGDVVVAEVTMQYPARRDEPTHPAGQHEAILLVRFAGEHAAESDKRGKRLNQLALFRGVGMVVEYLDLQAICMGAIPFHAALLCGEAALRPDEKPNPNAVAADRFLRTAEPPNHDKWTSTPDLGTEYARGGKKAIDNFIKDVKDRIRDLVRPPADDLSDGPEALKELLRIGDDDEEPVDVPHIYRPKGRPLDDGSWSVESRIRLKPGEQPWVVEPVIVFQQETGSGVRVKWKALNGTKNCTAEADNRLLIPAHVREASFEGTSDPNSHMIDARETSIALELRKCEKQKGGEA